ncbi:MAG: hypothetical protein PHQ35_08070 [Phycisphaerae bacterium]|nr:hypothetical protein [Phycisphaerae bacterium]
MAAKFTVVTDSSLEVVGFSSRVEIHWENIEKVQIIEKWHGFFSPPRTDRLILMYPTRENMVAFNSNVWPRENEEDFLRILREKSSEYGFPISTETNNW